MNQGRGSYGAAPQPRFARLKHYVGYRCECCRRPGRQLLELRLSPGHHFGPDKGATVSAAVCPRCLVHAVPVVHKTAMALPPLTDFLGYIGDVDGEWLPRIPRR